MIGSSSGSVPIFLIFITSSSSLNNLENICVYNFRLKTNNECVWKQYLTKNVLLFLFIVVVCWFVENESWQFEFNATQLLVWFLRYVCLFDSFKDLSKLQVMHPYDLKKNNILYRSILIFWLLIVISLPLVFWHGRDCVMLLHLHCPAFLVLQFIKGHTVILY